MIIGRISWLDQRQHRQLRRRLLDRGRVEKMRWRRSCADTVMDLDTGKKHSRHPGMDYSQLARADRDRADLSGVEKVAAAPRN